MSYDEWYLNVCDLICNRTPQGKDKRSVYGQSLTVRANDPFPVLSLKHTPWRLAIKEMLWFLSNDYDYKSLRQAGVTWWDPWISDWAERNGIDFAVDKSLTLSDTALPYKRHFGAFRRICKELSDGNYDSTRLFCSLWPDELELGFAVLPPCALSYQLLHDGGVLSMEVYQRSADLLCGVPTNLAQYAFLLQLYSAISGLEASTVRFTYGDLHIYESHLAQPEMTELLSRSPSTSSCRLHGVSNMHQPISIDLASLLSVTEYSPQGKLKFPVAEVHTRAYKEAP